jgi:hypothetical protein
MKAGGDQTGLPPQGLHPEMEKLPVSDVIRPAQLGQAMEWVEDLNLPAECA